jgi:hypothetical protein
MRFARILLWRPGATREQDRGGRFSICRLIMPSQSCEKLAQMADIKESKSVKYIDLVTHPNSFCRAWKM